MLGVHIMTVIGAVIIAVAVALGGGSIIFVAKRLGRWLWRSAVGDLTDRLGDIVETHIEKHLEPLLTDVATIKRETTPNGGGSMKDEVTGLKTAVQGLTDYVTALKGHT